jgi:hypothetical protein
MVVDWARGLAQRVGGGRAGTFSAARLDDEDIFPSHALLNLDARLADLELAKEDFGGGDAEMVADGPVRV